MSEDEEIYWHIHDGIVIEYKGKAPTPMDALALAECYRNFKSRFFNSTVPDLSEDFICEFLKLPFDVAGITYLEQDAAKLGVKKGIRINEKLKEFPAEAKVALLHEMVHATGVRGHEDELKAALKELFNKGAYLEPLII